MKSFIDKVKLKLGGGSNSIQFAQQAESHRLSGEVQKAIKLCQEGVKNYPTYATGYYILARCYSDQGLNIEAKETLAEALRFDPHHIAVLNELAGLYHADGNLSQSLYYYNQALAIDPLNTRVEGIVSELSESVPEEVAGAVVEESTSAVDVALKDEPAVAEPTVTTEVASDAVDVLEEAQEVASEEDGAEEEAVVISSYDEKEVVPENEIFEEDIPEESLTPDVEALSITEEVLPVLPAELSDEKPAEDVVFSEEPLEPEHSHVTENIPVVMSGPWLAEMLQDYLPLDTPPEAPESGKEYWASNIFESVLMLNDENDVASGTINEVVDAPVEAGNDIENPPGDLPSFKPVFREEDQSEIQQVPVDEPLLPNVESSNLTDDAEPDVDMVATGDVIENITESDKVEEPEASVETDSADNEIEGQTPENDRDNTSSDMFTAQPNVSSESAPEGSVETEEVDQGSAGISKEVDAAQTHRIQPENDEKPSTTIENSTSGDVDLYLDQFFTGIPPVEDVSGQAYKEISVELTDEIKHVPTVDIPTVKGTDVTEVNPKVSPVVEKNTTVDSLPEPPKQKVVSENETIRDEEKMIAPSFDVGQGGNFAKLSGLDVLQEVQTQEDVAGKSRQQKSDEKDIEPEAIPTATLAELYVRQGLLDRAISVYLTLVEHDPTNPDIHKRLSELFVLKAQKERR